MSELALYRKYRPQTFAEVIGQEQVAKVLEDSIKLGNLSHAYLFSGSRGTGKTSVARILAREVGTSDKDVYEIDAASNRGIDEIRNLREGIGTLPFESKYKVYIIDEVHMLTKEAFNALLKTLEEPPKHVIFILATTELHKVPETIISRCQTYTFKKPTIGELKKVINFIVKKEGYALTDESTELLAFMGDGSFRDTIGILQKVINSSADKKLSAAEVQVITGAPSWQYVYDLVNAIADGDLEKSLECVNAVTEAGQDLKIFMKLIMREIRLVLLLNFAPRLKAEIYAEAGEKEKEFFEGVKAKSQPKLLPGALKEFLAAYRDMGYSYLPQLPLELALVKILRQDNNAVEK